MDFPRGRAVVQNRHSRIGTYAAAGARLGPAFLWTAPVTFPMMFAVVFLTLLVAVIGTTLSAYLNTWQSNQEVEVKIVRGQTQPWQRRGTSEGEHDHIGKEHSKKDVTSRLPEPVLQPG